MQTAVFVTSPGSRITLVKQLAGYSSLDTAHVGQRYPAVCPNLDEFYFGLYLFNEIPNIS